MSGTLASDYHTPTVMSGAGRGVTGALAAGALIGERYTITRLLGRGGFGAVYLANDTRFSARRVAVKEMGDARLNSAERGQALARFRQEAHLLSTLQHPNLPAVSDFLEEGGKAYLVMDFIDGPTLDEVLTANAEPLEEARVIGWALQICDVLAYLHSQPQPIIFRDLKPANTMITPAGQIKLIDFGVARLFRPGAERDTNRLGSQGYAAPEQYGIGQTDARTDIYALGAMLYTLLTGQEPLASITRMVSPGNVLAPRQLNPRISTGVEQVIITATEVEMSRRYQSVCEMAQAFVRLGFSAPRASAGMYPVTGPDAPTIASTQPGSYLPSATLHPASTQVSTSHALTMPQAPVNPLISDPLAGRLSAVSPGGPAQTGPASYSAVSMPTQASTPVSNKSGQVIHNGPLSGSPGTISAPSTPQPQPPIHGQGSLPVDRGRRAVLIGGGAALLAAGTGIYFFVHGRSGQASGSASGTVTVDLAYSTEKKSWLEPAANAFNVSSQHLKGSSNVIQVRLSDLGSVDSVEQIARGQLKPVAWSPASTLEVNRLTHEQQSGTPLISFTDLYQPRSLVKSPLVLAVWEERAKLLLQRYAVLDWDTLAQALQVSSWMQLGGQASWGQVKFGQTLPTQSNSGLLTITLLAYHYYNKPRGLSVQQVNNEALWKLAQLLQQVTPVGANAGEGIKVFTIAYGDSHGSGVDVNALTSIASASGGQEYTGIPQNIKQVYLDISKFF